MTEVWLHTNRRAAFASMVLPAAATAVALIWALLLADSTSPWRWIAWAALAALAVLCLGVGWLVGRPRLTFRAGHLRVALRRGRAIAVPIEIVEACFLGTGPALLPGAAQRDLRTTNLVIRLADRASDWAQREVVPQWGAWCGGYITLRGTWCEPLSIDLAQRLNRRLAEVQQRASQAADAREPAG